MPVSVSHVYNSCYNAINLFGTGFGWKLNVQQALRRETITIQEYMALSIEEWLSDFVGVGIRHITKLPF